MRQGEGRKMSAAVLEVVGGCYADKVTMLGERGVSRQGKERAGH